MDNLSETLFGGTMSMNSAGLAEGTNAHTIKTVAANGTTYTDYCINGVFYVKADTDNIAITACDQQAALTSCIYLVTIDTSGTVTITKGTERLTADITSNKYVLEFPSPPDDEAVLGYFRIDTATGYTYTAGTTDNGATGITDTYVNCPRVPDNPLTS